MVVAKWRQGFDYMFHGADARRVAEEISAIGENPTTKQIVDAGRNPDSELHKCFEWNDTVAAEKYRLVQARYIVHNLVIEEESVPEDRPEIRFFYKPKDSSGYRETRKIVRDENEYEKLLERAYSELRAFKAKYAMLSELSEIFDLIQ